MDYSNAVTEMLLGFSHSQSGCIIKFVKLVKTKLLNNSIKFCAELLTHV